MQNYNIDIDVRCITCYNCRKIAFYVASVYEIEGSAFLFSLWSKTARSQVKCPVKSL